MPHELSDGPSLSVNELRGVSFDVSDQIRDSNVGSDADKDMDMVRHRINLNHLLLFVGDDAGDVFVDLGFVLFGDEGLSSFDGKDDVYVELCVGVSHLCFPMKVSFMDIALLWSAGTMRIAFYRHYAPLERVDWTYRSFYRHIAPLERVDWTYRPFYRHYAPLERVDWIYRRSIGIALLWSAGTMRIAFYRHIAPLERVDWTYRPFYRHIAPLERKHFIVNLLAALANILL